MKRIAELNDSLISLVKEQYTGKKLNDYDQGRRDAFEMVTTFLSHFLNEDKKTRREEGEIKP